MTKLRVLIEIEDKNGNNVHTYILKGKREYILGRGKKAQIHIDHFSVSKKHCNLSVSKSGTVTIEDLESSNHTWIGSHEEKLEPGIKKTLKLGRHFKLGSCSYLVKFVEIID